MRHFIYLRRDAFTTSRRTVEGGSVLGGETPAGGGEVLAVPGDHAEITHRGSWEGDRYRNANVR